MAPSRAEMAANGGLAELCLLGLFRPFRRCTTFVKVEDIRRMYNLLEDSNVHSAQIIHEFNR